MKTCTKCKETKELKNFSKNYAIKDGYSGECSQCKKDRRLKLKTDIIMQLKKEVTSSIIVENKLLLKSGQRICTCCKNIYTLNPLRKKTNRCLDCERERSRADYIDKISYRLEYAKEYREVNKEKLKLNRENKKENKKEYMKKYRDENKQKIKEYKKQYQVKKKLEKEQ